MMPVVIEILPCVPNLKHHALVLVRGLAGPPHRAGFTLRQDVDDPLYLGRDRWSEAATELRPLRWGWDADEALFWMLLGPDLFTHIPDFGPYTISLTDPPLATGTLYIPSECFAASAPGAVAPDKLVADVSLVPAAAIPASVVPPHLRAAASPLGLDRRTPPEPAQAAARQARPAKAMADTALGGKPVAQILAAEPQRAKPVRPDAEPDDGQAEFRTAVQSPPSDPPPDPPPVAPPLPPPPPAALAPAALAPAAPMPRSAAEPPSLPPAVPPPPVPMASHAEPMMPPRRKRGWLVPVVLLLVLAVLAAGGAVLAPQLLPEMLALIHPAAEPPPPPAASTAIAPAPVQPSARPAAAAEPAQAPVAVASVPKAEAQPRPASGPLCGGEPVPAALTLLPQGLAPLDALCVARVWIGQRNLEDAKSLLRAPEFAREWAAVLELGKLYDPLSGTGNPDDADPAFARKEYQAVLAGAGAERALTDEAARRLDALRKAYP